MVTHNAKVKLQNPGGQTLQPETVHYLVMEAGVYTQPGVYTVTLMVHGLGGSDTLMRTNYITVSSDIAYTTTHRVISYTYDSLYRLTDAEYSTGEYYSYIYDPVGNRLSLTTYQGVVNYAYDDANRLTSVNGRAYTWDNNGNPSTGSGQAC